MCPLARKMGIPFTQPRPVCLPNDRTETYINALRDIVDKSVQLVITVFPQMKQDR